ncbi:MAG TPA: hypothetical protein VEK33_15790, partial [Terriglobales bacterium]|nr:hypothetical protein [Terriglobales bacterium]
MQTATSFAYSILLRRLWAFESSVILLSMTLEDCRQFYAEEIRLAANINSATLIEAFMRVPRENFLGPGPWKIAPVDLG